MGRRGTPASCKAAVAAAHACHPPDDHSELELVHVLMSSRHCGSCTASPRRRMNTITRSYNEGVRQFIRAKDPCGACVVQVEWDGEGRQGARMKPR